eukprot:1331470-Rhodomonas_salina.1
MLIPDPEYEAYVSAAGIDGKGEHIQGGGTGTEETRIGMWMTITRAAIPRAAPAGTTLRILAVYIVFVSLSWEAPSQAGSNTISVQAKYAPSALPFSQGAPPRVTVTVGTGELDLNA